MLLILYVHNVCLSFILLYINMKDNLYPIGMMYMLKNADRSRKEMNKLGSLVDTHFHVLCKIGSYRLIEDVMKYLHVDPSSDHSRCLILAVEGGKVENVMILIKDNRVDPTSLKYSAIKEAIKRNHIDIFYLLRQHIINYIKEQGNINELIRFYEMYIMLLCKYERTEMLQITHQEVVDSNINIFKSSLLENFFITYDDTKKQFLDTIIKTHELNHRDILFVSSYGSIEGLEYAMKFYQSKENIIDADIIKNCLNNSTERVLPLNVKFLLDFSTKTTLHPNSLGGFGLGFGDPKGIRERNKLEKKKDFIKMVHILFSSESKINRYTRDLILHLVKIQCSASKEIFDILYPYFFTIQGIEIMTVLMENELPYYKDRFKSIVESFYKHQ